MLRNKTAPAQLPAMTTGIVPNNERHLLRDCRRRPPSPRVRVTTLALAPFLFPDTHAALTGTSGVLFARRLNHTPTRVNNVPDSDKKKAAPGAAASNFKLPVYSECSPKTAAPPARIRLYTTPPNIMPTLQQTPVPPQENKTRIIPILLRATQVTTRNPRSCP